MVEFYILLGLAVIISTLFIVLWNPNKPLLSLFVKGLATISVISLGLVTINLAGLNLASILLLIGLLFCMLGDLVLALREVKPEQNLKIINLGITSFGIAQIFFIVSLAIISNYLSLFGLLFGLVFAIMMLFLKKPLKLDFQNCLIPSLIYAFLLASNVGGSLIGLICGGATINQILLFLGFALFIISDLILSKIYFSNNKAVWVQKVNYIAYYAGIILLACAFIIL